MKKQIFNGWSTVVHVVFLPVVLVILSDIAQL